MSPSKLTIPENFSAQGGEADRHLDAMHWSMAGMASWLPVTVLLVGFAVLTLVVWSFVRRSRRASAPSLR